MRCEPGRNHRHHELAQNTVDDGADEVSTHAEKALNAIMGSDVGRVCADDFGSRRYRATQPPQTGNTWPTKQLAASLHR